MEEYVEFLRRLHVLVTLLEDDGYDWRTLPRIRAGGYHLGDFEAEGTGNGGVEEPPQLKKRLSIEQRQERVVGHERRRAVTPRYAG